MSEIFDSSAEKQKSSLSEKIDNNNEWLNANSETGAEKHLDADTTIKEEKTWMETLRGQGERNCRYNRTHYCLQRRQSHRRRNTIFH